MEIIGFIITEPPLPLHNHNMNMNNILKKLFIY